MLHTKTHINPQNLPVHIFMNDEPTCLPTTLDYIPDKNERCGTLGGRQRRKGTERRGRSIEGTQC